MTSGWSSAECKLYLADLRLGADRVYPIRNHDKISSKKKCTSPR